MHFGGVADHGDRKGVFAKWETGKPENAVYIAEGTQLCPEQDDTDTRKAVGGFSVGDPTG